ncbi:prephenate dehydratase [Arcanobacterium hippocoleae]
MSEKLDSVNTPAIAAAAKPRFAFLGPRGTFCQQALNQVAPESDALHIPALDAPRAINMVCTGEADYAVVPIENSVEGGINSTIDTLTKRANLAIAAEMLVPITFVLAVRRGVKLAEINRISTHNAAWTQCHEWILENLPQVAYLPAASTAAGAAQLAAQENPGYEAALVSPLAAAQYGLEVLHADVADNPNAVTRFVLIGKAGSVPNPTGRDKTTLMVQLPSDGSGALLQMLTQFATLGINLSRIESRPIGDSLGRYAFSIDADGHIFEKRIQAVLAALHRVSPKVTFLGSYPAARHPEVFSPAAGYQPAPYSPAEASHQHLAPGTSDADFHAANAWVAKIISGAHTYQEN